MCVVASALIALAGLLPTELDASTMLLATRSTSQSSVAHVQIPQIPRTVACAANASVPERYAAEQLVHYLRSIEAQVSLVNATSQLATTPQLAVGYGAARLVGVHAASMTGLGREGYVLQPMRSGTSLALSGGPGAPRGTLYAVNEFLEALGVQFLAANVTVLPSALPTRMPTLRPRYIPQLEYRQTYGYQMIDAPDFNVHLRLNKGHFNDPTPELDEAHGGVYPVYATPPGDAHTSYALLPGGADRGLHGPPPQLWASHRQWFWPQADNASDIYGQLCWSNRSLQAFLVSRVKGFLRAQPKATLISVSQNDNGELCETADELAIVREEGGARMGPMLRAINFIADAIKSEFPDVAIATLAYGETSSPPISAARPNVMIQLAPISADYGRPLSSPSNKPFRDLIVAWGRKSSRLFVWNYVGGFECFLLPFPNYYALARDIQFLTQNGVTGIFNEASYVGPGGDFAEHNEFVVSKMMWEPALNGTELSAGFLRSYYSEAAAVHVKQYMDILTQRMLALDYYMELAGWEMTVFAPIFDVATIVRAGASLQAAVHAAQGATNGRSATFVDRVEKSSLSLYWVVIHRYGELRFGAKRLGIMWPFEDTNKECFEKFERLWNMTSIHTAAGTVTPGLGEGDPRSLQDLRDENLRICPSGLAEGQLITLFNGGIRNSSGVRGPEVIATAVNASSFGEQHCAPAQAGLPACHYTFTVLGHWVSALAPTAAVPQWIEWELNLRSGMGIGQVQALQLPSADGAVQHQLLFDGAVATHWARHLVVDAVDVIPAPSFCQVVFSAIVDCANTSNSTSCNSNPPLSWDMPSVPVNLSPQPATLSARAKGCRRDLLFEFMPAGESVDVSKARLLTTQAPGNWVAWSAVSFTMCPLPANVV